MTDVDKGCYEIYDLSTGYIANPRELPLRPLGNPSVHVHTFVDVTKIQN